MKLLLISCGGTIVSPPKGGVGVRAGQTAPKDAVEELKHAILTKRMLLELYNRETNELKDAPCASKVDLKLRFQPGYEPDPSKKDKELRLSDPPTEEPVIGVEYVFDGDSTEVGPEQWGNVIKAILRNYDDYDGFIVTHGTNTLGYTASAITFGLPRLGKPVVMTGANIPIGLPFSDATVNASNAILLAHKLIAENRGGVVVVFASRVMPGSRTKKVNGTELEAFRTFNAPDIGQMRPKEIVLSENEFEKYVTGRNPDLPDVNLGVARTRADLEATSHVDFRATISSHTFHPGDDPATYAAVMEMLVQHESETGIRGAFIIRAVGDGDVSDVMKRGVYQLARERKIPVVVTTQEPGGTSSFKSNEISEDVEAKLGVIPAWDMSIETMVVKLRYLLAKGLPYDDIRREFVKSYHGEIKRR